MKPLQLPPLDTNLSTSSLATTPSASSPPTSTAPSLHRPPPRATSPPPTSPRRRRVSFCPLALLIDVAAEGEPEPALVKAAQEQLGKRKVALRAYNFDAPQIGDVAGKAWHSVLNGFTASLEPFLSGGGGGGSACSRSGGRAREHSPERLSGGRRRASSLGSLRSASPGRSSSSGGDDDDDPFFTPNPTTRLTLKLPALRRQCLRSLSTSPTRSILRRCAANVSLDAACRSPTSPTAAALIVDDDPPFPPLSPASSAPPPIASTHADDPAALSALVPLAPCCASCERATHYGLLPDGTGTPYGATYRERWTAGARKKRAEERREREAREKGAGGAAATATTADKLAAAVARRAADKGGKDESEEEKEAEEAEEEARASRLGQLAAKGGVDELARERGRRGTLDAPVRDAEGDEDVGEPATPVEAGERKATTGSSAARPPVDELARPDEDAQRLSTAAVPLEAPHSVPSGAERLQDAPLAVASAPSRPPLDSTTSAPAALPNRITEPALPSLSRTTSPSTGSSAAPPDSAPGPVRPTNKRRLSTATASLSRFAAAFGQGLMHSSSSAGAAGGAGVRA
ncbi:hypothetical protein JCM9279_007317 [Rhodotorula babjevae]